MRYFKFGRRQGPAGYAPIFAGRTLARSEMNLGEIFRQRKQNVTDKAKKGGEGILPGVAPTKSAPQGKEESRIEVVARPPTFHGYDMEETLKDFDLNMHYGPCLGLARLERWERAERMGLKPPPIVKQMLEGGRLPNCIWEGRV